MCRDVTVENQAARGQKQPGVTFSPFALEQSLSVLYRSGAIHVPELGDPRGWNLEHTALAWQNWAFGMPCADQVIP